MVEMTHNCPICLILSPHHLASSSLHVSTVCLAINLDLSPRAAMDDETIRLGLRTWDKAKPSLSGS